MDIGRAFSYVFDDEQWLASILIGGLLLLIPILGPIVVTGYMLEAARNVAAGNPRPLPRWENFGEKVIGGLYGLVIQIVYSLPVIVIACLIACISLAMVPFSERGSEVVMAPVVVAAFCLAPLAVLISLATQPVLLAALARYVQTNDLSAALRVGEVLRLTRANLGVWVVLFLLQLLCGFVASLGSIALVIGVVFTSIYAQAVFGHLLGQTIAGLRPSTDVVVG